MAGAADIGGVGAAWEEQAAIRQLVLEKGTLFKSCSGDDYPLANVKTAALNVVVLLPLMGCLANEDGLVQMVSISDLEREYLVSICFNFI